MFLSDHKSATNIDPLFSLFAESLLIKGFRYKFSDFSKLLNPYLRKDYYLSSSSSNILFSYFLLLYIILFNLFSFSLVLKALFSKKSLLYLLYILSSSSNLDTFLHGELTLLLFRLFLAFDITIEFTFDRILSLD
jgi:hypothetical protein